jgi:hypothetical protein
MSFRDSFAAVARVALVTAIVALGATAQDASAQTAVEQAVRAPIDQMFAGMKARDTMMIQSAFVPVGRLISIREPRAAGQATVVGTLAPADFARSLLGAPPGDLLERLWDYEYRIEGNVANVWAKYSFHIGEKFSHCGIDAFQLAKTTDGWKIVQIMDTRQTAGCRDASGKDLVRN